MMTDDASRSANRLLRHDRMVVANTVRSALSGWSDRLVALVAPIVALGSARALLVDRPFFLAAVTVAALAGGIGMGVAWAIGWRLAFHAHDGVLAAPALHGGGRQRYALAVHAAACGSVATATIACRPAAVPFAVLGYGAVAASAHLVGRIAFAGRVFRRAGLFRGLRAALHRPIAGVIAALTIILPMLFASPNPESALVGPLGLASVLAVLALTFADAATVRFMTLSGYAAGRIVGLHARAVLLFLLLMITALLTLSQNLAALIVGAVGLAGLTLMIARILAYRVHSKRAADMMVGSAGGLVVITGLMVPLLLPVLVSVILWRLHRRAAPATWGLA